MAEKTLRVKRLKAQRGLIESETAAVSMDPSLRHLSDGCDLPKGKSCGYSSRMIANSTSNGFTVESKTATGLMQQATGSCLRQDVPVGCITPWQLAEAPSC